MDDITIPQTLVWLVIAIGILVQFLREFQAVNTYSRFIPYLCIGLGVAGAYLSGSGFPGCVQIGVAIGLMAAGGYDAIKAFSKPASSKTMASVLLLCGVLAMGGCAGPLLIAEQKMLLNQSSVIVDELDRRCQAGDDAACREGLSRAAETLRILSQSE